MSEPQSLINSPEKMFYLDHWGSLLSRTFKAPVYLVGSAVEGPDYNDVDIRCVLTDGKHQAMLHDPKRLMFLNIVISEWLMFRTGFVVDFQFQSKTQSDKIDKPRHVMGAA